MNKLMGIMDPDELLDAIAELADQRQKLDDEIQALTVRAVHHLGARRYSAAASAMVSRPTLNKWIDDYAATAGPGWENTGS